MHDKVIDCIVLSFALFCIEVEIKHWHYMKSFTVPSAGVFFLVGPRPRPSLKRWPRCVFESATAASHGHARHERVPHLYLGEMQHGPLVGDDVKIHGLPHGVTHQAAYVALPGDDDQVHACVRSHHQQTS